MEEVVKEDLLMEVEEEEGYQLENLVELHQQPYHHHHHHHQSNESLHCSHMPLKFTQPFSQKLSNLHN